MDTIYNSTGYYQDNLGPLAGGVQPVSRKYYYPAHFPEFHWWRDHVEKPKVTTILRDEIPIPILYNRYPYRYTSAAPCTVGRTQKEWEIYKCERKAHPIVRSKDKVNPKAIRQIPGYETASMTASLAPFLVKIGGGVYQPSDVPKGLNEPSLIPYHGVSEFDKYVVNFLYPNWKSNPLYRRRLLFDMRSDDANTLFG